MEKREKPRPMGRPPKFGRAMLHSPIALRLPEAVVEQIDAIVADRLDQPDRSAVIRELIVEALTAREKKRGRG
jgi:metal-responsive CopG/Arc/MetJ family transcriptional regulator